MPRSQIPHGNRPRVPAGSEPASFPELPKPAPHHSRPLPAYSSLRSSGLSPSAVGTEHPHPEPATRAASIVPQDTFPLQNSMDQADELEKLRLELAALKLRIGGNRPSAKSADMGVTPMTSSAAGGVPASGSLHESKHVTPVGGTAAAGHGLATGSKTTSAETSRSATAVSASTVFRGTSNNRNMSGAPSNSRPFASRSNAQEPVKSLLGQSYNAPSTEKFVKRGAVKIVSVQDAKAAETDHNARQEQNVPEEACRSGDMGLKTANGDASEDGKKDYKLGAPNSPCHSVVCFKEIYATSNGSSQPGMKDAAEYPSAKLDATSGEKGDFSTNSGRRICISNLPVGATDKDIRELIDTKANSGASIEAITVFRRPNSKLAHAMVDVATLQDASHIVKWTTDEQLFGWPIVVRIARDMSKDDVEQLIKADSAPLVSVREKASTEQSGGKTVPCRYFASGYCGNGAKCKFSHGIADDGSSTDTSQPCSRLAGRRNGTQHGKRGYDSGNNPGPAEGIHEDDSESIFGTKVYRSTALRIHTDES